MLIPVLSNPIRSAAICVNTYSVAAISTINKWPRDGWAIRTELGSWDADWGYFQFFDAQVMEYTGESAERES